MLAIAVGAGLVSTAGAERAKVLGKSKFTPKPECPSTPSSSCEVTGQVTGFQRSIGGKANVFKAPKDGKIVAWSVDLSKPSKEERDIFGEAAATDEFGKNPTAGISILRKRSNGEFKLMRASPILRVQRYYGKQPIITLRNPLKINEGNIVALTTATWLPAFANRPQSAGDAWVGSRPKKNCTIPDSVPQDQQLEWFFDHTRPHRKVGSSRKYACVYPEARILYWAYFSPRG